MPGVPSVFTARHFLEIQAVPPVSAPPSAGPAATTKPQQPPVRITKLIYQAGAQHDVAVSGAGELRQQVPAGGRSSLLVFAGGAARTRLRMGGITQLVADGTGLVTTRLLLSGQQNIGLQGFGAPDLIDWPTIWREEEELVMLLLLDEELLGP